MLWIRTIAMINNIVGFILLVCFTLFMLNQCEADQKRNDAQNIEFSKGNY